ncbi:hypothetical protein TNCV_1037131 [Trichonephila clavipes]|nr:hypothetical protein TNCV_1037131 [Trichonephila clavipes]
MEMDRPWTWGIPTAKSRKDSSRGSRRLISRKIPADDSIVIEMVEEHLFHTTGFEWRNTILHNMVAISHRLA